jgi:hypothetical protein
MWRRHPADRLWTERSAQHNGVDGIVGSFGNGTDGWGSGGGHHWRGSTATYDDDDVVAGLGGSINYDGSLDGGGGSGKEELLEYPCRPSTTKKFKQIRSSLTKLLGSSKWCVYFKWWFSCELRDFFVASGCCVVIHEIKCINSSIHNASVSVVLWGTWMWMNCRPSTTKLTIFFHPLVVTTSGHHLV